MVNTINLFLIQCFVDLFVQVTRGLQICTKWFFNNDTSPSPVLSELICLGKHVNDVGKSSRRCCHVINAVSRACLPIFQQVLQLFVTVRIIIMTLLITEVGSKAFPLFILILERRELFHPLFKMGTELFIGKRSPTIADDVESFWHSPLAIQIKQGWHKLALCQIPGGPKDNNRYR